MQKPKDNAHDSVKKFKQLNGSLFEKQAMVILYKMNTRGFQRVQG